MYDILPKPPGALQTAAQQLWGVCSGAVVGEESPQRVMQLIVASCPLWMGQQEPLHLFMYFNYFTVNEPIHRLT